MRLRALVVVFLAVLIVQAPVAGAKRPRPPVFLLAAGDITGCPPSGASLTARLIERLPGTVAALGDQAYPDGTISEYQNCYTPTWGRFKARTRPTPGNHDYALGNAHGYFSYFGARAHPPYGYYSYSLGSWHVIVINSNCKYAGGCGSGSAQLAWLRADLAAHPARCTLAYWHHARFSVGPNAVNDAFAALAMQPIWQTLVKAGVDLALTAHDHMYERFAPLNTFGWEDPAHGMREFVVGTGGGYFYPFARSVAGIQKVIGNRWGVLRLRLLPSGYRWQFLSVPGGAVLDSGSSSCHDSTG